MVWAFTKNNHALSCDLLVRWWIRTEFIKKFLLSIVFFVITLAIVGMLIAATTPSSFGLRSGGSSPFMILIIVPFLIPLFVILDAVIDRGTTKAELQELMNRRDIVRATRAEYIGGHPKLPHGRFAYLLLEGSYESPLLTVVFPAYRHTADLFQMPVLEVEKAKGTVAKLVHENGILGHKLTFITEYTGEAGRKHEVELAHFFDGNEDVQLFRNYIVCLQAEADTGKRPFGHWKTLPHTHQKAAQPVTPRITISTGRQDLPEGDGRNDPPWLQRPE